MPPSPEFPSTACFSVHAGADASVMPRVLEQFAKRGLVPCQWHSSIAGVREEELHIDLQVRGLDPGLVERIACALREIVQVELVLTSEKRLARSV